MPKDNKDSLQSEGIAVVGLISLTPIRVTPIHYKDITQKNIFINKWLSYGTLCIKCVVTPAGVFVTHVQTGV